MVLGGGSLAQLEKAKTTATFMAHNRVNNNLFLMSNLEQNVSKGRFRKYMKIS